MVLRSEVDAIAQNKNKASHGNMDKKSNPTDLLMITGSAQTHNAHNRASSSAKSARKPGIHSVNKIDQTDSKLLNKLQAENRRSRSHYEQSNRKTFESIMHHEKNDDQTRHTQTTTDISNSRRHAATPGETAGLEWVERD